MRSVVMTIALSLLMTSTVFGQLFPKPVAVTTGATNIEAQSATLNGKLTQCGLGRPQSQFRYRRVGTSTWTETDWKGSLAEGDTFSEPVTGLTPDTQYEYQCRARTLSGMGAVTGDWSSRSTFTTPPLFTKPVAITTGATNIEAQSATLNGKLTKRGLGLSCQSQFRYGRVGSSTWTETNWKGRLAEGDTFSETAPGLTPDTQYEYQCRARMLMSMGAIIGDWSSSCTFRTPPLSIIPRPRCLVTVCTPTVGSVTPSPGAHEYWEGSSVGISATAPAGANFVRWDYTDGISVDKPTSSSATMTVNSSGTLCPVWDPPRYTVTVCTPTGGSVSPSPGDHTYTTGPTVSITASPAWDYHFVRWNSTGGVAVASATSASTTMTVNDHGTLCPVFEAAPPTYTVTVCTPTGGTISPSPGAHSYDCNSLVPVTASPTSGYRFKEWKPGGDVLVQAPTAATTLMAVNGNGSLCATFEKDRPDMEEAYYVDASARGRGDGSSWTNAFNYLQEALAVVQAGQTIWMAEGVYTPDQGTSCTYTLGDPQTSFMLVSGVAIAGGFPAGGGAPQQRNPDRYQTVLSGDIGLPGSMADNSCHVVMAVDCNVGTILDGLTIAYGNAGGGLGCGAGLQITSSALSVVNCTFTGNVAANAAGVCCQSAEVEFTNCVFTGNTAELVGGAVGIWDCAQPVFLINCTFSGNGATTGGAIYASTSVSAILANSILWGNVALQGSQITLGDGAVLTVAFCDVQGGRLDVAVGKSALLWSTGNLTSNPSFADADGADDLAGTLDDRLDLLASSPCLDAGDDTLVSLDISDVDADGDTAERIPLDLAGTPRFLDASTVADTGVSDPPDYTAIVDLGAYELRTQR